MLDTSMQYQSTESPKNSLPPTNSWSKDPIKLPPKKNSNSAAQGWDYIAQYMCCGETHSYKLLWDAFFWLKKKKIFQITTYIF